MKHVETFLDWFNSDLETRRTTLILEIESAFSEVTKGSGSGIREAAHMEATYGPPDSTWEQRLLEARALDEERWQDIPAELFTDWSLIQWTNTRGFKYLLPAYLRYWLVHMEINPDNDMFLLFLNTLESSWFTYDGLQFSAEQVVCLHNFCGWTNEYLAWFGTEALSEVKQELERCLP
jgi:hypothetical protein